MASPTVTEPRHRARPAAVVRATPGREHTLRAKVRTQWLVLGAALVVLAGLLVAWGLSRAADRVDVVSVARPVSAGTVLRAEDLTITAIAVDGTAPGLVPAASLTALVGRATTIDLQPGTLLTVGMWADASSLADDERTVGAVLKPGRYPAGLAQGMSALALSLSTDGASDDGASDGSASDGTVDGSGSATVRVLVAEPAESGGLAVTLAVAEADAARIARLGATDQLLLVGLPATSSTGSTSSTSEPVP